MKRIKYEFLKTTKVKDEIYEARILQNGAVPVSDTYRIPILRGYSGYRIPEVSELIILI